MSGDVHMSNLVASQQWSVIKERMMASKGKIGEKGNRYAFLPTGESFDIYSICKEFFDARLKINYSQLAPSDKEYLSTTIDELKRLYNESQNDLVNASLSARLWTYAYDGWEMLYFDGFHTPVDRVVSVIFARTGSS
jgi:hypothetical protein